MTEPLTVRLAQLRDAATDLHTIAVQLRCDIAALDTAEADVIDTTWQVTGAQRRAGRRAVTRLIAIIRDLDLTARALIDAAEAYLASDDRSAHRVRAVPW